MTAGSAATNPGHVGDAGIAYDAAHQYVLLSDGLLDFAGGNAAQSASWSYTSGTWAKVNGSSSYVQPSARWGVEVDMTYDVADGYVVLFGGEDPNGSTLNDTWTFSGGTWTQLFPLTSPAPRTWTGMTYDAADGYVLLFAGGGQQGGGFYNDTWSFLHGAWTKISSGGNLSTSPSARRGPNLAYDAADG